MSYMFVYKEIGELIRRHRKRLELTQEALAQQIEMSRASLANIESGRQRLLVHQLYEISHALKIDLANLLPTIQSANKRSADLDSVKWSNEDLNKKQQSQLLDLIADDFEENQ